MKNITSTTLSSILLAITLSGCSMFNPKINYPVSDSKTSAVLVIIEDSYINQNNGAVSDMNMMSNMISKVTDDIVILKDGDATRKNVKEAISRACSNELAIVFFSAHGGHEGAAIDDTEFEKDNMDEYIYLSDTSIDDNELWELFSKSTNRVFAVFDCCYGGGMFRGSKCALQDKEEYKNLNLLSWGACKENEKARVGKEGGLFIQTLNRIVNNTNPITYNEAWTIMRNASDMRWKYRQIPEVNVIGDYNKFKDIELFK